MKKGFLLGFGASSLLFSTLFLTSFTQEVKHNEGYFSCAQTDVLYKDCGHEITFSQKTDSIVAEGAYDIVKSKTPGFMVMPNAPKTTLKAYKDGKLIGEKSYKVLLAPKPTISLKKPDGRDIDRKRGERAGGLREIVVSVDAPDFFKLQFPKDARYESTQWEAMLVRGKRPVNKRVVTGSTYKISQLGQQKPGDRFLIEIKKIIRKNYTHRTLPVSAGSIILNIPLTE